MRPSLSHTQATIKMISNALHTMTVWPSVSLSLTFSHTHKHSHTQAAIKIADVLRCDPLSLTHKPQLRWFLTRCTLWPSVRPSLSHSHSHTHKHSHTQAAIKIADVLRCDTLSLTHKPQLRWFLTRCTLWPSVRLSLSHSLTHTHTHIKPRWR